VDTRRKITEPAAALSTLPNSGPNILVVRLGSMGDIIHTLPAVATLKHNFPGSHLSWAIDPKWAVLLEGNPFVDGVIGIDRKSAGSLWKAWRELRGKKFGFAVDFQSLIKSAIAASLARPDRIFGFHQAQARERLAALFYSKRIRTHSAHMVDRNLELAAAAGASSTLYAFPLPPGIAEGRLPEGRFVLACPLGGWTAKQWPMEYYDALARRLNDEVGIPLVLSGPPQAASLFAAAPHAWPHLSGMPGLIYATRQATAVVGIDSGPLHMAAALDKPGVAIYGPSDPGRTGPYGNTMKLLRSPRASISYKRHSEISSLMREISPDAVFEALKDRLC
jgi:heptosyltransferase I